MKKHLVFNKHLFDLCLIITYFPIFYKFFFSQRGGKIYEDKIILSAFTTLQAAKNEIELNYSEFPENFNIEPCALNIDARFINEIKKEMGVENGK